MFKRMILMLYVIGAVFAALAWFVNFRAGMIKQAMASLADPPQTVSTTTGSVQRLAIHTDGDRHFPCRERRGYLVAAARHRRQHSFRVAREEFGSD
ncbi:hypothetical protein BjapCC829_49330 (plasmid) [Bradyrhizobium barranii]|uniref:Uncharacterized protein n=1 Tax=Bradyrhizobium barranii TaxID=2992140 RepID=A0ABY3R129_9BRAD|nr:hypothetical protein [Bradyrhizobium japonicum]UFW91983.1 hypothetical protein BjapCC829_49330 [Bradyrhizobium japonicum]